MRFENLSVPADGSANGNPVRLALDRVQYQRRATGSYDNGATATVEIVQQDAGGFDNVTVLADVSLDASALWRPRAAVHGSDGTVIANQWERHFLGNAYVQITVTGGGSGSGDFLLTFV